VRDRPALRSAAEIAALGAAGRVVREVLDAIGALLAPGITTADIDRLASDELARRGARAAFKGYHGFPASICVSVNDEVVHGIPSRRALRAGDLVSLDFGAVVDGWYGDAAVTLPVGEIDAEAGRLLAVTREALALAVAAARPRGFLGDVGAAVQRHVERSGFSVVRDFVGHGIGRELHEAPQIPNYGVPGTGLLLRAGMVLAIEPMVNAGSAEIRLLDDGWTAVTADGSRSAHFEHTVAVTETGPLVLTAGPVVAPPSGKLP